MAPQTNTNRGEVESDAIDLDVLAGTVNPHPAQLVQADRLGGGCCRYGSEEGQGCGSRHGQVVLNGGGLNSIIAIARCGYS